MNEGLRALDGAPSVDGPSVDISVGYGVKIGIWFETSADSTGQWIASRILMKELALRLQPATVRAFGRSPGGESRGLVDDSETEVLRDWDASRAEELDASLDVVVSCLLPTSGSDEAQPRLGPTEDAGVDPVITLPWSDGAGCEVSVESLVSLASRWLSASRAGLLTPDVAARGSVLVDLPDGSPLDAATMAGIERFAGAESVGIALRGEPADIAVALSQLGGSVEVVTIESTEAPEDLAGLVAGALLVVTGDDLSGALAAGYRRPMVLVSELGEDIAASQLALRRALEDGAHDAVDSIDMDLALDALAELVGTVAAVRLDRPVDSEHFERSLKSRLSDSREAYAGLRERLELERERMGNILSLQDEELAELNEDNERLESTVAELCEDLAQQSLQLNVLERRLADRDGSPAAAPSKPLWHLVGALIERKVRGIARRIRARVVVW